MTRELVEACVADPDDDAPRLVWADAVGGERGEFVVIQCALARGDLPPADAGRLRRRQRDLLAMHGADWSQLRGIATRVMFRRGFVEAAEIDCGRFLDDNVLDSAPLLRSLNAIGLRSDGHGERVAMAKLEKLFRSPAMQRLVGLSLREALHLVEPSGTGRSLYGMEPEYTYYGYDAIRLADKLGQHHLRAFGIQGSEGMGALRETAFLRNVERLWLDEDCSLDDIVEAIGAAPKLVALELGKRAHPLDKLVPKLPTQLHELHVSQQGAEIHEHVAMLAQRCPQIEKLSIHGGTLRDPSVLHGFPRLRSLFATCSIEPNNVKQFLSRPMAALRELTMFSNLSYPVVELVLEALGPQLEYLDLLGNGHMKNRGNAFANIVAGVVRLSSIGRWNEPPPLLHTHREPDTTITL